VSKKAGKQRRQRRQWIVTTAGWHAELAQWYHDVFRPACLRNEPGQSGRSGDDELDELAKPMIPLMRKLAGGLQMLAVLERLYAQPAGKFLIWIDWREQAGGFWITTELNEHIKPSPSRTAHLRCLAASNGCKRCRSRSARLRRGLRRRDATSSRLFGSAA